VHGERGAEELSLEGERTGPILHRSQRDVVVSALLEGIADGTLAPGMKLTVSNLAGQLDVSSATIREALGALNALHLIDEHPNRPARVVTPTPRWYVAMAAECVGLSIAAADLGIALATPQQRADFCLCAEKSRRAWRESDDQYLASVSLWELIQLLANYSTNRYLADLHAQKRHALAFGLKHLSQPRNANMLIATIDALTVAVQAGDRDEGVDIVRDLYAFVIGPFVEV